MTARATTKQSFSPINLALKPTEATYLDIRVLQRALFCLTLKHQELSASLMTFTHLHLPYLDLTLPSLVVANRALLHVLPSPPTVMIPAATTLLTPHALIEPPLLLDADLSMGIHPSPDTHNLQPASIGVNGLALPPPVTQLLLPTSHHSLPQQFKLPLLSFEMLTPPSFMMAASLRRQWAWASLLITIARVPHASTPDS